MAISNDSATGVRWGGLGLVIALALSWTQAIVVARYLARDELGLVALVLLVVGLVESVGDLGLSAAIVQRPTVTRRELSSLFWAQTVLGGVSAGAIALASPWLAAWNGDERLGPLVAVAGSSLALFGPGIVWRAMLLRGLGFRGLGAVEIGVALVRSATACALAVTGAGAWAIAIAHVAAAGTKTVLLAALGVRGFRPELRLVPSDLRGYVRFGVLQLLSRTVGFAAQRVDQIVIRAVLGLEALGTWYFAQTLVSRLRDRLGPAIGQAAFPVLARAQDDRPALRREFLSFLTLSTAVVGPVLLALAALATRWVGPVFGDRWSDAAPLVVWLAVLGALRIPQNTTGLLALARGRPGLALSFAISFVALDAALVSGGASSHGLTGAAVSLVVGEAVFYVVIYRLGIVPLVGSIIPGYTLAICRPLAIAGAMAVGVAAISTRLPATVPGLLLACASGVTLYTALSWVAQREVLEDVLRVLSPRRARARTTESRGPR